MEITKFNDQEKIGFQIVSLCQENDIEVTSSDDFYVIVQVIDKNRINSILDTYDPGIETSPDHLDANSLIKPVLNKLLVIRQP